MEEFINDVLKSLSNLTTYWPIKMLISFAALIFTETFNLHLHLFLLFALLEFVDCLTKWLALSYALIVDGDQYMHPGLWDCFKGLAAAHRAHYIQSEVMRKQFFSKMLTYLILIIVAGSGDYAMRLVHKPEILLSIIVTYICITELLSVLENLNDAGVSIASSLIHIIKAKTGMEEGEKK